MNKNLTEDQQAVKELLEQGASIREAARVVLERESRESSIRHWVKNGLLDKVEEVVETPSDELSEQEIEVLCENGDWSVSSLAKRLRTAQRNNNQLRKIQRELFDTDGDSPAELLEETLNRVLTKMKGSPPTLQKVIGTHNKKTVEILFSDLQIGKCSQFYNTEVAKKALQYYGDEVLTIINRVQPEHIVFASLGDVVEDHLKHGVQSAISTDTSLAEQMADAIAGVWWSVLKPLLETGIPVTFIGIQGNHGSSEHKGMDMFKAGRYGYDYTIHKTWETMCAIAGYKHITFKLPVGCFDTFDIYGQTYLYEHGYTNNVGEKQMEDHKKKRQENLKTYIHGFRCGDKHHSVQYNNSNLMCNGAFFGIEMEGSEYSGILGFNSIPVQAVVVHEPVSGVGQSTITEVVQIQIAKGY